MGPWGFFAATSPAWFILKPGLGFPGFQGSDGVRSRGAGRGLGGLTSLLLGQGTKG